MKPIVVRGTPAPQGSKRGFVNKHTGKVAMVESAGQKVKDWRSDVKAAAEAVLGDVAPMEGPLSVTITFVFARPKHHFRAGRFSHLLRENAPVYKASTPDLDKLLRATYDALTAAGVWRDDAQVVVENSRKVYVTDQQAPGAIIRITEAP